MAKKSGKNTVDSSTEETEEMIGTAISDLERKLEVRFQNTDEVNNARFDSTDQQLSALNSKFNNTDNQLSAIQNQIGALVLLLKPATEENSVTETMKTTDGIASSTTLQKDDGPLLGSEEIKNPTTTSVEVASLANGPQDLTKIQPITPTDVGEKTEQAIRVSEGIVSKEKGETSEPREDVGPYIPPGRHKMDYRSPERNLVKDKGKRVSFDYGGPKEDRFNRGSHHEIAYHSRSKGYENFRTRQPDRRMYSTGDQDSNRWRDTYPRYGSDEEYEDAHYNQDDDGWVSHSREVGHRRDRERDSLYHDDHDRDSFYRRSERHRSTHRHKGREQEGHDQGRRGERDRFDRDRLDRDRMGRNDYKQDRFDRDKMGRDDYERDRFERDEYEREHDDYPTALTKVGKMEFPKFDGSDVEDWVFRAEQFFELETTDREQKWLRFVGCS